MSSTNYYRTHNCSQLSPEQIGEAVHLSGWVHRKRDHGGLLFIDLRDHYGITQCVFDPDNAQFDEMTSLPNESVIKVVGEVVARPDDTENEVLTTGGIEIQVKSVEVLGRAAELALPVFGEPDYPEDLRLAWRVLDLRRKGQHERIMLRQAIIASMRARMVAAGFMEFQTPILTAPSPEGARDFVVPSRLHPGKFYSLPQAPQMFKQLIMMAGFDRYFQIAPCFRDEDARADRSPGEFYQLDIEMSFVEQEDILQTIEPILHGIFEEFAGTERSLVPQPFERIKYFDALAIYGTDKPDLRNPLKMVDVSDCFIAEGVAFKAFRSVVEGGGVVRAIAVPDCATQPRSFFDKLNAWAREEGAAGLGYIVFADVSAGTGPIAKFIPAAQQQEIIKRCGVSAGSAVFFICDEKAKAERFGGLARTKIAETLGGLIDESKFYFCWIVDMPMFEIGTASRKLEFAHNPFSMPQGGLEALSQDPLDILGYQYDIVCNGIELSSGAVRNHRLDILFKAFEIIGSSQSEVEQNFPAMVRALSCGAPPHGGIAPGIDRIVMLLAGADNLRDVVMFPLNQQGEDLLLAAPSAISDKHLEELWLKKITPPPKAPLKAPPAK